MKRLLLGVGAIGIVVLAVSIVSAQAPQGQAQGQGQQVQGQGQPQGAQPGQGRGAGGAGGGGGQGGGRGPAPPTNLQVLPKDMTGPQVIQIMQAFAAGLGVQCNYCHVTAQDAPAAGGRGRGGDAAAGGRGGAAPAAPMNDFASDAKPTKRTARTMMLMARDVNSKLGAELGKPAADVTQVQCVTCHRGVAIPKQLVDIVADMTMKMNAAAAVAQYRDLRKQYYGSASYDFSDYTLFLAAQRAIAAMRPDDALGYLQANLEFNSNSARSYQQMSVAYQRKNDRENAIKSLEKAVELDPMNMGFRNQLNNLRNPIVTAQE